MSDAPRPAPPKDISTSKEIKSESVGPNATDTVKAYEATVAAKTPVTDDTPLKTLGLDGLELSNWQAQTSPDRYLIKAKRLVIEYLNSNGAYQRRLQPNEVYILSFSKTAHDWIATIRTVHQDKLVFEVVYNGHEGVAIINTYQQVTTTTIRD